MHQAYFPYDFLSPRRIVFGWGRRAEIGPLARSLGRRAFVVCGSRTLERSGALGELLGLLARADVEARPLATITREPEVDDVDRAVAALRQAGVAEGDLLLAIGGGSAIDLAKAVAALVQNPQSDTVRDYLEGVGRGLKIERPPLPLMAVPTTAGTGSEATKNAVISCYDPPFKKSLRSDQMIPAIVLVDPELAVSVPPEVTAWTGMDAITQLIEAYITRKPNPVAQALAISGLEITGDAIVEAYRDGSSRDARQRMAHAALLSGMALANSGLGMAHGVAAALGVHCRVPHGLACAVMLPVAMRVNRPVREAQFARIGRALSGRRWPSQRAAAEVAVERVEEMCQAVGVPRWLSEIGVRREQIPALVAGSRGNSMNGNPRDLSDELMTALLEEML
jgi:alcohol dehydrogenase class IV